MSAHNSTVCNGNFKNVLLGWVYIGQSSIYLPAYVLCFLAFLQKPLREKSCYKIMAAIGFCDILLLNFCGYICGFLSITGVSFCENWWQLKVIGAIVNFSWISYCCLCVVLAINRVVHSGSTSSTNMFSGSRVGFWICGSFIIGGLHLILLLSPYCSFVFHSGLGLFLYDPITHTNISVYMGLCDNISFSVAMVVLYTIVVTRVRQVANSAQGQGPISATERSIILQSFLVCFLATTLALMYVIVPQFTLNVKVFLAISLYTQFVQGSNALIYLFLNKAVRHQVKVLLHLVDVNEPATQNDNINLAPTGQPSSRYPLATRPATVGDSKSVQRREAW